MSEIITASNIDLVIQKNREIEDEVTAQATLMRTNPTIMTGIPMPQLAILILQGYGLIQMPVEDKYWSGAIYVKDGKFIPVINTALPRVNQYFAAWHEVYHLVFDKISFDHYIGNENMLEERKAELFAAKMLLTGVERYFIELSETDFISKAMCCMSAFQAPYKAVLVSLYEYAFRSDHEKLRNQIKEVFDLQIQDMPERFRKLGLDESPLMPSYVVNTVYLQERIKKSKAVYPELKYHAENEDFLENIMAEIRVITRRDR